MTDIVLIAGAVRTPIGPVGGGMGSGEVFEVSGVCGLRMPFDVTGFEKR